MKSFQERKIEIHRSACHTVVSDFCIDFVYTIYFLDSSSFHICLFTLLSVLTGSVYAVAMLQMLSSTSI